MNIMVKKYIGFIYYGCCGIKELHQNVFLTENYEKFKDFSFKYGLLLLIREELAFVKNKTFEYYSTVEDFLSLAQLYCKLKQNDELNLDLSKLAKNKSFADKYKFLALNISSDLMEIIEVLKLKILENNFNKNEGLKNIEDMQNYLRIICMDVENLANSK